MLQKISCEIQFVQVFQAPVDVSVRSSQEGIAWKYLPRGAFESRVFGYDASGSPSAPDIFLMSDGLHMGRPDTSPLAAEMVEF